MHAWPYSIVLCDFRVCMVVHLSQLGEAWEHVNGRQLELMYGWFELAGLYISMLHEEVKRCQYFKQQSRNSC